MPEFELNLDTEAERINNAEEIPYPLSARDKIVKDALGGRNMITIGLPADLKQAFDRLMQVCEEGYAKFGDQLKEEEKNPFPPLNLDAAAEEILVMDTIPYPLPPKLALFKGLFGTRNAMILGMPPKQQAAFDRLMSVCPAIEWDHLKPRPSAYPFRDQEDF